MKEHLTDLLFNAVRQLTDEINKSQIIIERPKLIEHGDFSTNIALVLSKTLKKQPRDIAQLILDYLPEASHFNKIESQLTSRKDCIFDSKLLSAMQTMMQNGNFF